MKLSEGLVAATLLDGQGSGREVTPEFVNQWHEGQGLLWLHMDYKEESARRWVREHSGVDPLVAEALLATDTRPRFFEHDGGLFVTLRGVNLNPDADLDDLISIRIWLEKGRILTMRHRRILAVDDMREALKRGDGACSAGDFLARLVMALTQRKSSVLSKLMEQVDTLEDELFVENQLPRDELLSRIRRQVIGLRRYLVSQRDAVHHLQELPSAILDEPQQLQLREEANTLTRYVEDLEQVRERSTIALDEIERQMSKRMNRTLYLLSLVTAIFLPLGFITGLLGINVGGMPGTDYPGAFAVVCAILLICIVGQLLLLRRLRWV